MPRLTDSVSIDTLCFETKYSSFQALATDETHMCDKYEQGQGNIDIYGTHYSRPCLQMDRLSGIYCKKWDKLVIYEGRSKSSESDSIFMEVYCISHSYFTKW